MSLTHTAGTSQTSLARSTAPVLSPNHPVSQSPLPRETDKNPKTHPYPGRREGQRSQWERSRLVHLALLSFIHSAHRPSDRGGPRLWVPPLGALTSQGLELTSGKAPRQGPGQASWSHLHPGRRPIINQLPSIPPAVPQTTDFSNLENNCTLTKGNWNLFRVQLPGPKCEVCAISSDSLSAPPQSGGPHPTVNSLPPRSGASKDLRPGWVTGGAAPTGHLGSRPPAVPPPPAHPPR